MSDRASAGGRTGAVSTAKALRRLYLTLFLRGYSARGLRKSTAPRSIGSRLWGTLLIYGLVGLVALIFLRQQAFVLSIYLHGMTLVFLGAFVAASTGEILFNENESEILLHRPVTPQAMLWAKVRVLVEVSLWLALAFNLTGLLVGVGTRDGGWLYPLVHCLSLTMSALFSTASVIVVYQLCLRWFGRERLDNLMTAVQVLVAISFVVGGQIVPRLIGNVAGKFTLQPGIWWLGLLPPAWFAGVDDLLAGSHSLASLQLALTGVVATSIVAWLAFGKLARDYERGLQTMSEAPARRVGQGARRRLLDRLVQRAPLRWWLRDSVERGAFLLSAAYMLRDRDVKLRLYPSLAPMLVLPVVFLLQGRGNSNLGVAFAGSYLGLVPMLGQQILRHSQQWQAADIFRAAPIPRPAVLGHGMRKAVMLVLALPAVAFLIAFIVLMGAERSQWTLVLPGIIAMPVYALVPSLDGGGVPLSNPVDDTSATRRGLLMFLLNLVGLILGGLALWANSIGWLPWLILGETLAVVALVVVMRMIIAREPWPAME
jgi:ABC-2 type transport system permease protein